MAKSKTRTKREEPELPHMPEHVHTCKTCSRERMCKEPQCLSGGWTEHGDGKRHAKMDLCPGCGSKVTAFERLSDGLEILNRHDVKLPPINGPERFYPVPLPMHAAVSGGSLAVGSAEVREYMGALDRYVIESLGWRWAATDERWHFSG
jgi:hypothetical protein